MLAGAYARAAGCAREANDLARAELERRNRSYQPDEHEHLISGLIRSLDRGLFRQALGGPGIADRAARLHRRAAAIRHDA